MVAFDLPTKTAEQRKNANDFREWLKKDGYQMLQFSVYVRPCVSFARQTTHIKRLKQLTPPEGHIRALFITRSQWERSYVINGPPGRDDIPEGLPEQIMLW
ncbi:MAG: CRISPR-associated endonuclease Cas2 [Verrucomicrobiales bacterium]|nr:CRISPR-associated endonuclease Cas2 [Verrucomicrobiales bacterium]